MSIILLPLVSPVAIKTLRREVEFKLPEVPTFEVDYRMRQAVQDFCRQTLIWKQRDTVILTTEAGVGEYDADLDEGVELVKVVSAWYGAEPLRVAAPGEIDTDQQPGLTSADPLDWVLHVEEGTNVVTLTPAPLQGGIEIKGTVAFAPNEDSDEVPLQVWRRWRKQVAAGCIARLKGDTDKPWSAPNEIAYYQHIFDDGVMECATKSGLQVQSDAMTVQIMEAR